MDCNYVGCAPPGIAPPASRACSIDRAREEDLALARIAAEDWYLNLRGLSRVGLIRKKKITFSKVAD